MDKYRPVSCSFNDMLEIAAIRHEKGEVLYLDEEGKPQTANGFVQNIKADSDADYLVVSDGTTIRLDRIARLFGKTGPAKSHSAY